MEICDWQATRGLNEVYRSARLLGLESALAELETFGFTVVENVLGVKECEDLREDLIAITEEAMGEELNRDEGRTYSGKPVQKWFPMLLCKGRIFRGLLQYPVSEVLTKYLLGSSVSLSAVTAFIRGPGDQGRELHCDDESPDPLPRYAQVANLHWVLSDYTLENGALSIVPGSHRLCRMPVPSEGEDVMIPVNASPGSVIFFHGNTWHGAYPRIANGLRITISAYFNRGSYRWQNEDYLSALPSEVLSSLPESVMRLLGSEIPWHWNSEEERRSRREKVAKWAEVKRWQHA